ncbi:Ankyrin repeat-containing protein [Cladophialophora immunda]|nr:Ankyrin repeat-containing protein [Cladophialophora immunda]
MPQSPPSPELQPQQAGKLLPRQEAMVEVCKVGQLSDLQKLFDEHDVKGGGDHPVPHLDPSQKGAPETAMLFEAAISHGHPSIVRYLHSIYPKFDFYNGGLLHAIIERPDLDMVELLYSYCPRLISYAFDDHHSSVLNMACQGGPTYAEFIHFLLDNGANPSREDSFTLRLGGDLTSALDGNQPTEIIKKMIPKTPYLFTPIYGALKRKRADALDLLLDEDYTRGDHASDPSYGQSLLRHAKATGDEEVIAVVERWPYKAWWSLLNIGNKTMPSESHHKKKDLDDSASDEEP